VAIKNGPPARQSGSDRLEKQPTDLRQDASYFGDRTPALKPSPEFPAADHVVPFGDGSILRTFPGNPLFLQAKCRVVLHVIGVDQNAVDSLFLVLAGFSGFNVLISLIHG
jgi:hypothetical protein